MEETVASMPSLPPAPSSTPVDVGKAIAAARSLAPGLLSLRPSPMVAREEERRELMDTVGALCSGIGTTHRMIALIGEAGVGKSRLVEWLCEQVHERGLMWPLRARYGRTPSPLDGLTGAVNKYFNLEGADRELVDDGLGHVRQEGLGVGEHVGGDLEGEDAEAHEQRDAHPALDGAFGRGGIHRGNSHGRVRAGVQSSSGI